MPQLLQAEQPKPHPPVELEAAGIDSSRAETVAMERTHDRIGRDLGVSVDKRELLQQQSQQQQQLPQLPGAASPTPWQPPLSAENESRQGVRGERCPRIDWRSRLDGGCGGGDERNNEMEGERHDGLFFWLGRGKNGMLVGVHGAQW